MNNNYKNIINYFTNNYKKFNIPLENKNIYTNIELFNNIEYIEKSFLPIIKKENINILIEKLINCNRKKLIQNICHINNIIKKHSIKNNRICHSGKKTSL